MTMTLTSERPADAPVVAPGVTLTSLSEQVGGRVLAYLGQYANAIEHAFHRPEIGKMDQQLLARGSKSRRALLFAIGLIDIAVDEIRNDADLIGNPKNIDRAFAQVVADGSHAV